MNKFQVFRNYVTENTFGDLLQRGYLKQASVWQREGLTVNSILTIQIARKLTHAHATDIVL